MNGHMRRIFRKGAFVVVAVILLGIPPIAKGQSAFVNLNFQSTSLSPDRPFYNEVASGAALPGWTVKAGENAQNQVFYNTVTLDGAGVSLHGSGSQFFEPYPGDYSVYIQATSIFAPVQASASISQTGFVPLNASSLQFVGHADYSNGVVSLGGQNLGLTVLGQSGSFILDGADIRSFAGSTQELRLTAVRHTGFFVDDIQFSSVVVPEPGMLGFAVLGLLVMVGKFGLAMNGSSLT
jgi:hypothetical protein